MLGHAVAWGVINKNVITKTVSPPAASDKEEITVLDEEQIGVVLRHFNGHTLRPIVSFLLGTGARRGEALALRWKDVDLNKNIVRIERSVEQTKAGLRIKPPKTRHGRRNISISPWLGAELKTHLADRTSNVSLSAAVEGRTAWCSGGGMDRPNRRSVFLRTSPRR